MLVRVGRKVELAAVTGYNPNDMQRLRVSWFDTIERAVLMADSSQIRPPDLGLADIGGQPASDPSRLDEMTLEDIEKLLIKKALNRYGGNARRAAEALGLSRSTFYRRLQQYGL